MDGSEDVLLLTASGQQLPRGALTHGDEKVVTLVASPDEVGNGDKLLRFLGVEVCYVISQVRGRLGWKRVTSTLPAVPRHEGDIHVFVIGSLDFPSSGVQMQTFSLSAGSSAAAVDRSQEWASAVLQPLIYSVAEVQALQRAVGEPLPSLIPVHPSTYASLGPDHAAHFMPSVEHDMIACQASTFLNSSVERGWPEGLLQGVWDNAFGLLWSLLLRLSETTSAQLTGDVVDCSLASTRDGPSETLLWVLDRLCCKFEEKHGRLADAYYDLVDKLANLPGIYYGPVQWIIGIAIAGTEMVGWAMTQQQTPQDLIKRLSVASMRDRATCLRVSINILRVAVTLSRDLGSPRVFFQRPFTALPVATYGSRDQIERRLRIAYPKACKEIQPWSEHVAEGLSRLEFVRRAYAAAGNADEGGIVSGTARVKGDRYRAIMDTVGYEHRVYEEKELWIVMKSVLKGLRTLHEAGLVHRDVRWKNILKVPDVRDAEDCSWVLVDLETVWERGQKPSCRLNAWDDGTLVDGCYTEQSDLNLVGKLMAAVSILSPRAKRFEKKLLQHEYDSAFQALQDCA